MRSKILAAILVVALLSTVLIAVSSMGASASGTTGTTGSIVGQVEDPKGDPIANFTVTLSNGMTATTSANGRFAFAYVPAGNYTLSLSASEDGPGVQVHFDGVSKNVTVVAGQTTDVGTMTYSEPPILLLLIIPLIIVIAVVIVVWCLLRRRKRRKRNEDLSRRLQEEDGDLR